MVGKISGLGKINNYYGISPTGNKQTNVDDPIASTEKKGECQTCKNRKYVDGSDEMVSYKAPANISPNESAARVMAHEQEHVSNAFGKAAKMDGKVLQASVQLKMAICPECGRSYVAGGTTTTKISYPQNNPYADNKKSADRDALVGANLDMAL